MQDRISALPPEDMVARTPREPIFLLFVEQYHATIEHGILRCGDPVELLDGLLVARIQKSRPHTCATLELWEQIREMTPPGFMAYTIWAVTLSWSEPEPDLAVVRGELGDYSKRHPFAADVPLVVEVADATLERDRGLKLRIYARDGIAEYWVVNLVARRVEVYTRPTGAGAEATYADRRDYGLDAEIPVVLDGVEVGRVQVKELFPLDRDRP